MIFRVDDLQSMNGELKSFLDFLEQSHIPQDAIFNSRLVSCELITNVLRHCGESALFEGFVQDDAIHILVSSPGTVALPTVSTLPDVFAESGRGLFIIRTLCDGDVRSQNGVIEVKIKVK